MNVARYDAGRLGEAMLSGDRARLARMLEGLRGEGEAPPRVLWLLAEEIRAVCRVQDGIASGRPPAEVLPRASSSRGAVRSRGARRSVTRARARLAKADRSRLPSPAPSPCRPPSSPLHAAVRTARRVGPPPRATAPPPGW